MPETTLLQRYMAALQKMPNPVKDTSAFKYKYAQLDQVLALVKQVLTEEGLAIYQRSTTGVGDDWHLETIVTDGTGEKVIDTRKLEQSENAQIKGSYETYMRRYALLSAFGLAAEDDDGALTVSNQNMGKDTRQPAKSPQRGSQSLTKALELQDARARVTALTKECANKGIAKDAVQACFDGMPKRQEDFTAEQLGIVEGRLANVLLDAAEEVAF